MRVSLPICIGSSLVVIVLSWWLSTRSHDFMAPPSAAQLDAIRIATAQTNPVAQGLGDALSPNTSQLHQSPIAVILPRHVNNAPALDDYREDAKFGADYLIELAELLKLEHPQRALTCWERVLDSAKASEDQAQRATQAILQLRRSSPPWNDRSESGIPIVIQAGTGPKAAALIQQALEDAANHLGTCSSAILRVESKISIGTDDLIEDGMSPVAMWISGLNEGASSTDVVSFFIRVDKPEGLSERIQAELYRIIRHHLSKMDNFQPLPKPGGRYSTDEIMEGTITRMVWKSFAESLQK